MMYVVAADDLKGCQLGAGRADFGQDMVMFVQANEQQKAESSGGWVAAGQYLAGRIAHTHDSGRLLGFDRMKVEEGVAETFLAEAGMVQNTAVLEIQSADMLQSVVLVQAGPVEMDMGYKRMSVGTEKSYLGQN